jgi:hypothetical protein
MIRTIDIAWAAGFLEGEGTFRPSGPATPMVRASQVQLEPLERLHRLFGGRVYQKAHDGNPKHNPVHEWYVCSRRAIEVCETIYVLMSPRRRDQIDINLAIWKRAKHIRLFMSDTCVNGHELTPENTRLLKHKNRVYAHKSCRICRRSYLASRRHKLTTILHYES